MADGLGAFMRGAKYGLRAQMLRARVMEGLREWHAARSERRYEGSGVHVGNLVGAKCNRRTYYEHTEGETGFVLHSEKALQIFHEGIMAERQLEIQLRLAKIETWEAEQVLHVGRIVGTPDKFITWMKKPWIIECKSMRYGAWPGLKELWKDVKTQASTYMQLYGIPRTIVPVKGKGWDDWKYFELRLKDCRELGEEVITRGLQVAKRIEQRRIPHRACAKYSDKLAIKCPFRDMCFKGRDRDVD